jgi:hypothetical protein
MKMTMLALLVFALVMALHGFAVADEPGSICRFNSICYDWDFAVGDHGFTPVVCDAGAQVWEYGATTYIPGAPGNVWGTVLEGDYVANTGDGLLSPAFTVVPGVCDWLEIRHYIHTDAAFAFWQEGGNVTVNGTVISPLEGYSGWASSEATCVGTDPFTLIWYGDIPGPIRTWGRSCFDLSPFVDQEIQVSFNFGSDASGGSPGWYLAYVKVGNTDEATGNERQTWGALKSMYK